MNPDPLQQAWHSQAVQTRLTIDADLLLKEVQRNQQTFTALIFWRDVREVGVSLLLIPVWVYMGVRMSLPWTWYLTIPALVWIAGFMLLDRIRQKRRSSCGISWDGVSTTRSPPPDSAGHALSTRHCIRSAAWQS